MSNFSSDSTVRLQAAAARECRLLADEIAGLGAQVSGGTAGITALQAFDSMSQHAQALGLLLDNLARMPPGPPDISRALNATGDLIAAIALPRVRARLLGALHGRAPEPVNDDDTVLWGDA